MIKRTLFVASCLVVLGGCSLLSRFDNQDVEKNRFKDRAVLEMLNEIPTVLVKPVARMALESAVQRSAKSSGPRVVPVFRRNSRIVFPEHRIFELQKDGPLVLLGLKNGDILLGINDRALVQPELLGLYPSAVLQDGKSSVIVRRGEQLFELQIVLEEGA